MIAGCPKAGKTSAAVVVARQLGLPEAAIMHTDDLVNVLPWSAASAEVSTWLDEPGPWIVEGVAAVRALRKWLDAHPEGTPCDRFVWYREPLMTLTPAQAAMAKGCETVLSKILAPLLLRGLRPVLRAAAGAEVQV